MHYAYKHPPYIMKFNIFLTSRVLYNLKWYVLPVMGETCLTHKLHQWENTCCALKSPEIHVSPLIKIWVRMRLIYPLTGTSLQLLCLETLINNE